MIPPRELDDAALVRAIAELYVPGAPEPELGPLCAALAGREVALPVPGGAVRVDLGDWTSIVMLRLGAWEPHLLGLARTLVRPGAVAIDVGAHAGAWTLLLGSLVGPTGRVIAYEPYPPSAARARAAIEAADLRDRVQLLASAAGERAGAGTLHGAGDAMLCTLVPDATASAICTVTITTLDELPLDRADVVKIDTEGYELAVLRGARALLARSDPSLIVELHAAQLAAQGLSIADVVEELRAQGFTAFDLRPEGHSLHVVPLRGDRPPTTHHILARRDPAPFVAPLR
ncbi:MAG: FkbM family methyltransferase [Deltaproteobacteria bacterium]|nr:FkbM family methyltransferase [Deltaproteobacteria bacterium]